MYVPDVRTASACEEDRVPSTPEAASGPAKAALHSLNCRELSDPCRLLSSLGEVHSGMPQGSYIGLDWLRAEMSSAGRVPRKDCS